MRTGDVLQRLNNTLLAGSSARRFFDTTGEVKPGVTLDRLPITRDEDKLSHYQRNTKIAKHWFCSICGICFHHQRRSVPTEYGYNLACIEASTSAPSGRSVPAMARRRHWSKLALV